MLEPSWVLGGLGNPALVTSRVGESYRERKTLD